MLAAEAVVLIMQLVFLRFRLVCKKDLFLLSKQDLKLLPALLPATSILLLSRTIAFSGHLPPTASSSAPKN